MRAEAACPVQEAGVTRRLLTTDTVPVRERTAYWCDVICDVFVRLDCDPPRRDRLDGRIVTDMVGAVALSEVRSTPQVVTRGRRHLTGADEDDILLSLQLTGSSVIVQDGRMARLRPGDFAAYDSSRPYTLAFDGPFRQLVVQAPREAWTRRLGRAHRLTARAVPGESPEGRLAGNLLRGAAGAAERLDAASAGRVGESLLDLLAAALVPLAGPGGGGPAGEALWTTLYRARTFIEEHLDDPQLTVTTVASALGFTPRYLTRLFALEGESPARYIWRRRLERCRDDLLSPSLARRPVSAIAYRWGFNSPAHFSRAFRDRYGLSPRAFRATCLRIEGAVPTGR